jgi:hypothetical protein
MLNKNLFCRLSRNLAAMEENVRNRCENAEDPWRLIHVEEA